MTDPYGTVRAKILDLQGNAIGGQPSNNDWRFVVDNEQLKFQHYSATANGGNGAFLTRQSFGNGLTGINVVPQGTYSISGSLQVTDDLTVDGGSLFVDASSNRVGFGTLTPSTPVHIVGDTYVDGDLTITGSSSISSSSSWTKVGGTNELYYIGANVGIGVADPTVQLDVLGTSKFTGDMTIDGDLTISSTTTTVNSTIVAVADSMFKYASNNATDDFDMGWYGKYIDSGLTKYSGMFRDATDNTIKAFTSTQVEPGTTVNVSGAGYTKANVVVGDIDFTSGTMRGSIIPDTDSAYDIGSAEKKIRDLYVSESSLWVGDQHKVTISGGKMKFRKRKTTTVPAAVTSAGGNSANAISDAGVGNLSSMKLHHWKAYMRTLAGQGSATVSDIFRDNTDDYQEESGANSWLDSNNNVYLGASGNVGIGDSTPSYKLDVTGDINFTGTLRKNGSKQDSSPWTEASSETYYTGNVGIGNTNPVEKLDVNGGMKIGTATGTANGTIQWTGSELQVRIGGAWKRILMFDELPFVFTTFTFTNTDKTGYSGRNLSWIRSGNWYSPEWINDDDLYYQVGYNSTNYNWMTSSGIQLWTVPETASYTIDAYGASGGNSDPNGTNLGGKGARMMATFSLTEGDKFMILVGQRGLSGIGPTTGAGGGGGTFIVKGTEPWSTWWGSVIIVAGGGGGAHAEESGQRHGGDALFNPGNWDSSGGAGSEYHVGGGAGFDNDGAVAIPIAPGSPSTVFYGRSFKRTDYMGRGGGSVYDGINSPGWPHGGFGGGGAGDRTAGGGGGGYNGGDAGYASSNPSGKGGGSRIQTHYNVGTNITSTLGNYSEHGKVIITKL